MRKIWKKIVNRTEDILLILGFILIFRYIFIALGVDFMIMCMGIGFIALSFLISYKKNLKK